MAALAICAVTTALLRDRTDTQAPPPVRADQPPPAEPGMIPLTIPEIKRLLGSENNFGEQLGLTKDWAYRIVKLVGNYGEVFERNVGQGSPLKIARGLNALWNKGGVQYAPPIR